LDKNVAIKVASGILSKFPGKTKIIFTNSLEFWKGVDQIIYLENGKIVK
jgi:ABC-type transport system involved in cytochrome bd biosynthesis fused ATPase/permease subunit